jgi:hypothetical protein
MNTAAQALHLAIVDAVDQLEPLLLPLFTGGAHQERAASGAQDILSPVHSAVRPTQRTQHALKKLVALTRFHPEEHRARRAGAQLELIWPPLVQEPRGAAACKLLQYYFRLREDLLDAPGTALRRAMLNLVRGTAEEAQLAHNEAHISACNQRLRLLASFLPNVCVDAGMLEHLSPLARLFFWQQLLEWPTEKAGARDAASPWLLPDMLAVQDRCAVLCRASDGSLEYFCNSGLARGLWQLRGLARFGKHEGLAQLFDELDDDCLDMHLAGSPPRADVMQQWLVRLLSALQQRDIARSPQPYTAAAPELPLGAIYDQELANYRYQLQAELQGTLQGEAPASPDTWPLRVTAPLVTLLYKLTWVFAAAELRDWSRFCHCAYRVALQHWRTRRPVSAACDAILRHLAVQMDTGLQGSTLRHWRGQLLQDCPRWTDDSRRPISLHPENDAVVALESVPDLLSGSFATLVQAGRLAVLHSAEDCQTHFQLLVQDASCALLQELSLLEHGAAAMKIWPLEQLCTLLIAVYETHLRDAVALPAELLQDTHRRLVRMLDLAAAWREAEAAPVLVQALERWLCDCLTVQSACREPRGADLLADGADCEPTLRAHLLSCLGTLASVLERPVRLQLDVGKVALDADQLVQVVDCLRPLIKFMLLDQSVDARTRHAMHKPRISTLAVSLRATSATLTVTAGEDSHEDMLSPAELQRLQRRLPKAAGPLACESRAGRGRSFTFTLACHDCVPSALGKLQTL